MPCVNTISGPLVIRYKGGDNGSRPITPCDATNPYWGSPSLWLEHPTDTTIDEATTKVGVDTKLKVLVHNMGAQPASNVNVEAYVCNFTLGVSPGSAIVGTTKFTGFVSSIGTGGSNSATVTCNQVWTPTSAQLAINNGHVCMFANCFTDSEGQSVDTMAADPVTHSLPFCCDSHLAQRNIRIVAASQGQGGAGMRNIRLELMATNPSADLPIRVSPAIRRVVGPNAIGKNERWMLQTSPLIKTVKIGNRNRFVLADQGQIFFTSRAAERRPILTPDDVVLIGRSRFRKFDFDFAVDQIGAGHEIEIPLEPREAKQLTVNLQLNEHEALGSTHTFDISQTTPDGAVIGGARILVIVVP